MTNNQSPFGAFAEGIAGGINQGTSNYLVGRQFRQQQEQQATLKELQSWQKGILTMQMVIDSGKQFKDPISRQNFYNHVLTDDFLKTMPAQVGTFASAFKNMPVNQQNDFAVVTKELYDMAIKGDLTNFPITYAKALALNHQNDWGGEKGLEAMNALYEKAIGKKNEAKAIEVFTQGVQSPSGYMRQTALSPTLDMGGLNKNLLSGSPNMQEGLMWKLPTEAQKLEAIANLPKDSKLGDRLMPKEKTEKGRLIYNKKDSSDTKVWYNDEPPTGYTFNEPARPTTLVLNPNQSATIAHNIRGEMKNDPYIKDFREIGSKYKGMVAALEESKTSKNLVGADQAVITLFNKLTDPNSVVRESEYARTPNNLSWINYLKGKIEKVQKGGAALTPEDREALVSMAKNLYGVYETQYNEALNNYHTLAVQSGINPNLVTLQYGGRKKTEQNVITATQPNTTSSGNRFTIKEK